MLEAIRLLSVVAVIMFVVAIFVPKYIPQYTRQKKIGIVISAVFVFLLSSAIIIYDGKPETKSASTAPVYKQQPVSPSPSPLSVMFASPGEATASSTPAPTPKLPSVGEKATVGKFDLTINGLKTAAEFRGETTEGQFVIVTVSITNNDSDPRDISSNMFKLSDGDGKTYGTFDGIFFTRQGETEDLVYETVNPGLTRKRIVVFETPKDISGLRLSIADGVALKATTTIDYSLE
ncbi:hypothetical protein BBD42_15280 [Paenibacillus sp. BIHB 4019]|uniref:DUF4352 domain-containing protein n=1 Tax=Paenibacillus sp. BIHB 4019 TaxID=1870819 RepID=A0A1B2DJ27_9BACL|nr:DUF4352 domain-containing protein [Paenibacillus sp. BIHB 4019]ANY67675.1 hypothetical protein BBD42_15280 [Paenibacillus sp. BIHB 4019]